MSAAEKLRELGPGPFAWYEAESDGEKFRIVPAPLADALPQIVAVVEAAEMAAQSPFGAEVRGLPETRIALAALERVLDGE